MMFEHSAMPEAAFFILVDSRFVNVRHKDADMLGVSLRVAAEETDEQFVALFVRKLPCSIAAFKRGGKTREAALLGKLAQLLDLRRLLSDF